MKKNADHSLHGFTFPQLLYNAEVVRDAPSGAGAQSALTYLLTPCLALGTGLSYLS